MEGFARILRDDFAPSLGPRGAAYAERIIRAAERMEALIADLLTFSRLQRAAVAVRTFDPTSLVRRAAEEAAAGREGATVTVEEPLPQVLAEPVILGQVMANLLGNAVKFHRPGEPARVRVRGERHGLRARICVEDEGIGIDPEHLERIFGAFERLHGQEAYPGTGIGLAIVKAGMERMGGTVSVVSLPGGGSRFCVELPTSPVEPVAESVLNAGATPS
jgi:signal transduction histidine kinase